jgi:hypothetical protein
MKRTNQGSLGFSLPLKLFGSDISLLEVTAAIFDPEGADVAIAIEPLRSGH